MTAWFVDSFYFIALMNRQDEAHEQAHRITLGLRAQRLVTTHWVLTEVADAFCSPAMRPAFLKLIEKVRDNPAFEVIDADQELWEAGLSLFGRRLDKSWSLTDCISFVVMEQRQLREALTGDQHFIQAGFIALLV